MIERNELITVCRHIGGMMEAGVDILRITRVLRAQTETPRLLQLYDALDRDMTMGRSLAEAMSRAPDVFSPFVVQMIQQGEARNDLAGAFLKIADFLKQEQELDEESTIRESAIRDATRDSSTREVFGRRTSDNLVASARDETSLSRTDVPDLLPSRISTTSPLTVIALDGLMDRLQTFMLRALTITSGLMLSLASVWWLLELGYVEKRWSMPVAFSVTAVFLGGAGSWIQRRIRAERRREARCSFCGRQGIDLQRAPRFAGAAICSRCAEIVAKKSAEDTEEAQQSPLNPSAESTSTPNNSVSDAVSDSANETSTFDETSQGDSPSPAASETSSTRSYDEVFEANGRFRTAPETVFDERNDIVSKSSSRHMASKTATPNETAAPNETATRKTARVVSASIASSRNMAPADEEDFE